MLFKPAGRFPFRRGAAEVNSQNAAGTDAGKQVRSSAASGTASAPSTGKASADTPQLVNSRAVPGFSPASPRLMEILAEASNQKRLGKPLFPFVSLALYDSHEDRRRGS